PPSRGPLSLLLNSGFERLNVLASVVVGLLYPYIGWRGMFIIGVLPALLVLYVRAKEPESPAWTQMAQRARPGLVAKLK
ncbi:MFS transporter, partial [Burkholderia pseudomallei]